MNASQLALTTAAPPKHEQSLYGNVKLNRSKTDIRLLSISPADNYSDQLITNLAVYSILDSTPNYVALSYTWGDPKITTKLACNGRQISVTSNLYKAMQTLRHAKYNVVWIDQLCINQGGEGESKEESREEKEWQIPLMTRIYSEAKNVLIYLGEENESSRAALRCLGDVDKQAEIDKKTGRENSGPIKSSHFDVEVWLTFAPLFNYAWFSRVWVIQEWLLAIDAEFAVGRQIYPAWHLAQGMTYVLNHLDEVIGDDVLPLFHYKTTRAISSEMINKLHAWRDFRRGYWTKQQRKYLSFYHDPDLQNTAYSQDLLQGLRDVKQFDCTKEVDRIYAIMGFFDHSVQPDYKSAPWKVYTKFASSLIKNEPVRWLELASKSQQTLPNLPSWVPDWQARFIICGLNWTTQFEDPQILLQKYPLEVQVLEDKITLEIRGIFVDSITAMTDPFPVSGSEPSHWHVEDLGSKEWKAIIDWHAKAQVFVAHKYRNTRYWRSKTRLKVLAQLLSRHLNTSRTQKTSESGGLSDKEALNLYKNTIAEVLRRSQSKPLMAFREQEQADMQLLAMMKSLKLTPLNQRIGVTSRGLFGLVPACAQPEDKIYLVPGMNIPLVLRSNGRRRYTFMGGAPTVDIMYFVQDLHGTLDEGAMETIWLE
jgi:hypothetical protein